MKAAYWPGVAAAFCLGALAGATGVRIALEKKLTEEYEKKAARMQNAYEVALMLQNQDKEQPAPAEDELNLDENLDQAIEDLDDQFEKKDEILTEGGDIETVTIRNGMTDEVIRIIENPYHKAISAVETPIDLFVDGGINDYGISYIEEEEYQDEDGRFKGKIDIIMDEHNPIFLMDGEPIDDWDAKIGDSILVDFYKLVPPGLDQVLYVRNHKTDEDYEVVRVVP